MVIRFRLTLSAGDDPDDGGEVQVTVSHNAKPGCVDTADLVWKTLMEALVVKTGFDEKAMSSITVTEW